MDLFLRIATLILIILWQIYWRITAKKAEREKPRTSLKKNFFDWHISRTLSIPILFQLLGLQILPIYSSINLSLIGFALVLLGLGVSVSGRVVLGTNWANAHEYQIKHKQTLVTAGIYKYIRHPIYTGLLLVFTGTELVCRSYLFIIVFILGIVWSYSRGRREEKLLTEYFGKEYLNYKKRTKMLIPFIF